MRSDSEKRTGIEIPDETTSWLAGQRDTSGGSAAEVERLRPCLVLSTVLLALASPSCLPYCVPAGNGSPKMCLGFIKPQSELLQKTG